LTLNTLLIKFVVVIIFYDLAVAGSTEIVHADLQKNGLDQKIGDYEVRVSTSPSNPLSGKTTNIMIGINISDPNLLLTDIPVVIKFTKNDEEISSSNPIFVSGGHLNYQYMFKSPGIYGLNIEFLKNSIEGDTPTNILTSFEFPLQVSDSNQIPLIPIAIGVFLAGAGIAILVIRRNYGIFQRLHK
jgi:hypothetical protein